VDLPAPPSLRVVIAAGSQTSDFADGLRFAVDELYAADALHGRRLRVARVSTDVPSDELHERILELLADKPIAIIADLGQMATAGLTAWVRTESRVPVVCTPCPPGVSDTVEIVTTDCEEGTIAARYVLERGWTHAYLLDDGTGVDSVFGFLHGLSSAGTIVGSRGYRAGNRTWAAELAAIRAAAPDVVFVAGSADDAAELLAQARALGLTFPFLGVHGWDAPSFASTPSAVGCFYVARYHPDDPSYADFAQRFVARAGVAPNAANAAGHDALVKAIRLAEPSLAEPLVLDNRDGMPLVEIAGGTATFVERRPARP
jgi:branched-chain amino acid transport system substrate-binding protein